LERTCLPRAPEEGGRSFIGEGTLEGGDEGKKRSLGRRSKGISIGVRLSGCRSILLSFALLLLALQLPGYYQ
tara:strand:- start:227 stop:442 length:216 start_codon:yes stop_codon:yes gene_type:complete